MLMHVLIYLACLAGQSEELILFDYLEYLDLTNLDRVEYYVLDEEFAERHLITNEGVERLKPRQIMNFYYCGVKERDEGNIKKPLFIGISRTEFIYTDPAIIDQYLSKLDRMDGYYKIPAASEGRNNEKYLVKIHDDVIAMSHDRKRLLSLRKNIVNTNIFPNEVTRLNEIKDLIKEYSQNCTISLMYKEPSRIVEYFKNVQVNRHNAEYVKGKLEWFSKKDIEYPDYRVGYRYHNGNNLIGMTITIHASIDAAKKEYDMLRKAKITFTPHAADGVMARTKYSLSIDGRKVIYQTVTTEYNMTDEEYQKFKEEFENKRKQKTK